MERDYRAAARVFKALCDPKRLAILEELRGGEKCACVLQEPMELTQSGLSYHMRCCASPAWWRAGRRASGPTTS